MTTNTETFTLVVYECVPEETKLYLIPNNVAEKYRANFAGSQNKFINSDDSNEHMDILSAAFCDYRDDVDEKYEQYACDLIDYLVSTDEPIEGKIITHVYLTGFVL